jgi:hypothetical protein
MTHSIFFSLQLQQGNRDHQELQKNLYIGGRLRKCLGGAGGVFFQSFIKMCVLLICFFRLLALLFALHTSKSIQIKYDSGFFLIVEDAAHGRSQIAKSQIAWI